MSSPALGTIYRSMADTLDAHVPGTNAALDKLRQKILKNLAAVPKVRDSFTHAWEKARTTRARIQATLATLGRISNTIDEMGDLAGPDLRDTHAELTTLLDVLRMLLWIEDEAAKRQCRWLFLESGKNNLRAHSFFERHGFREMSHVFIKPVGGK